jgi:hypothetical protein
MQTLTATAGQLRAPEAYSRVMIPRSWLRHYGTCRKIAGSILDVIGFFNRRNPSSRIMALGVDTASNRNEYQESSRG